MNEQTTNIMTPIMQYGFAATTAICLGIIVWMIKNFIRVLEENNKVIAANTAAVVAVDKNAESTLNLAVELKNELYKRPCIARIKVE